MGDYDFEGIEAGQVNKTFYIVWYFMFILVCVCILFNMFIAIVYEAFDTAKLYRISLKGHGSQMYRTLAILRYCLWPSLVIKMIKDPPKDTILTSHDLLALNMDAPTVKKILDIYGHLPLESEIKVTAQEEEEDRNSYVL